MLALGSAFLAQGDAPPAAGAIQWALVGLCLAALACAVGCLVALWLLVGRVRELTRRSAALDELERLRVLLTELSGQRGDLDLRRLEHVLVDMRDGQRRLEDALLRTVERGGGDAPAAGQSLERAGQSLPERIVNRLVALGYERVEIVSTSEELASLSGGDGDARVEARRAGVAHKGRVVVRAGRIQSVEIQPPFAVFP